MTEDEMRKQTIETYVNSQWYVKHTEKERRAMLLVLGSDRGLTDQTKRNANSDYYLLHQSEILANQKTIIKCSICCKDIKKGTEARHKRSNDCRLNGEILKRDNMIRRQNEEIERLKKIITDNKLSDN